MRTDEPMVTQIARHLDDAIDRLNEDLERVEIWTAALGAFLEPIPGYDSSQRFVLPDSADEPASRDVRKGPFGGATLGFPGS
jgi:hypothetical protein